MNFDELQKVWSQQTVAGKSVEIARLRESLADEVWQRSRSIRRIIGVGLFGFTIGLAVVLAAHFTGIKPLNRVTLATFILATLCDAVCLVFAFRALREMQREAAGMGQTLADSARASLRAVELQMRNCRWLAYGLLVGFVINIAVTFLQYGTGNLPLRGVVATLGLAVGFAAGIAATLRRHYREKLVPRHGELTRTLAELRD